MTNFNVFDEICTEMTAKQYAKEDHILNPNYTMIVGALTPLPFVILMAFLYHLRWQEFNWDYHYLVVLAGLIITMIIHELIHGIAWSRFTKNGFQSIKFGFNKGMPFCHCEEALQKKPYVIGAVAPLVFLGFGLGLLSLFIKSDTLLVLALLNIFFAGGDMLIILRALKLPDNVYLIDHPNLPGFVAFVKK